MKKRRQLLVKLHNVVFMTEGARSSFSKLALRLGYCISNESETMLKYRVRYEKT